MNKTLNKIKSNNNIIHKEKNPNNTIDNFKKNEKIKKFLHNNNNSKNFNNKENYIESIEINKERKNKIIKRIKNVQITFDEEGNDSDNETPKKLFDTSKINIIIY